MYKFKLLKRVKSFKSGFRLSSVKQNQNLDFPAHFEQSIPNLLKRKPLYSGNEVERLFAFLFRFAIANSKVVLSLFDVQGPGKRQRIAITG